MPRESQKRSLPLLKIAEEGEILRKAQIRENIKAKRRRGNNEPFTPEEVAVIREDSGDDDTSYRGPGWGREY